MGKPGYPAFLAEGESRVQIPAGPRIKSSAKELGRKFWAIARANLLPSMTKIIVGLLKNKKIKMGNLIPLLS